VVGYYQSDTQLTCETPNFEAFGPGTIDVRYGGMRVIEILGGVGGAGAVGGMGVGVEGEIGLAPALICLLVETRCTRHPPPFVCP
jgi:hypothetical protein